MADFGPWLPIDSGNGGLDPNAAMVNGYDVTGTGGGNPFPTPGVGGGGSPQFGGLLSALQGVKAPAAPTAQTPHLIGAPALRAPTPTRGDQFMQLISLLGNGPQAAGPQPTSLQPRLSQALGLRG